MALRATTPLRCSQPEAPAELARPDKARPGSDSPRRLPLRLLRFSASPTGTPKVKSTPTICKGMRASQSVGVDLPVFGPLKRRRGAQGKPGFRRGLSERSPASSGFASSAAAGLTEHRRAPRSEAEGRSARGRLSLVTFFGETKKVTRRQAKGAVEERKSTHANPADGSSKVLRRRRPQNPSL